MAALSKRSCSSSCLCLLGVLGAIAMAAIMAECRHAAHAPHRCRTNQLSEEDRARKLAEMSGNASVHEEARWQRLSNARKRDHADADPTEDGHDAEKFRKVAAQQVQGSQSVEQGVGRRKYYSEKDSEGPAFRR